MPSKSQDNTRKDTEYGFFHPAFVPMRRNIYLASKRVIDVVISCAAIILLSPVMLITAVRIKLQSPGPVIHKRKCVCKNGYYFMYKFRSMVADANNLTKYLTSEQINEYNHNIKVEDDPRITDVGKSIRASSIDELPQLFNVLKGEMSIIGPRPVAVEEACLYSSDDLDEILSVKPGITGYWQTHGRSDATYDSGKRQELELYYVRHQSFILDIKILLKTFVVVLRKEGAK